MKLEGIKKMKNFEIVSGIYQIKNNKNGKIYIGSSKNIYRRWKEHISLLEKDKHHSIKLQRAWRKVKDVNIFEFEILEICDVNKLLNIEQKYIDKFDVCKNGYNVAESTTELYKYNTNKKQSIKELKLVALALVDIIDKNQKHDAFYTSTRRKLDIEDNSYISPNIPNMIISFLNEYINNYDMTLCMIDMDTKKNIMWIVNKENTKKYICYKIKNNKPYIARHNWDFNDITSEEAKL